MTQIKKTFFHDGVLTELSIALESDADAASIADALAESAQIIKAAGGVVPTTVATPLSATTSNTGPACADCGGELEATTAFGRAPARSGIDAANVRKAKLEDTRNADVFKGMNATPRLLDAKCWKPFSEKLSAKFKNK